MKTEVSDLINAYNDTAKVFEKLKLDELLKNAQELFHSQIAIVDKEQKITYGELYAQVVELAAKITCENQPIGIVARRSIQTVVQIFAVLQSGNYYIPIDPNLPQERVDGSVLVGGRLFIADDQRNFNEVQKIIEEQHITIWNSVPSVLNYFLKEVQLSESARKNLKVCLLSGDYVSVELARTALETFPNGQIYSLGGATECSIWSILHLITEENIMVTPYIPYGAPMANQQIYILDQELIPVKDETVGQIAIAGLGVALGYIGDEAKTNETFIDHEQLGYLYLTGDLGQFCGGQHIKFTGRMDTRIKVNGYRVSLSEISSVFHQHFGFENRVFLLDEEMGTQKLVLAYQSKDAIANTKIRKELQQHLASYEIPHLQLNFSSFPLTANGKIDMKELKSAVMKEMLEKSSDEQLLVENKAEASPFRQMLAEVLKINHLSAKDSLFDLGVDSLQLVKIKNWLDDTLDVGIEIIDIYDCDDVATLENYVEKLQAPK
mgnify:CR=1 FL=1